MLVFWSPLSFLHQAIRYYASYKLSYRWVIKYAPLLEHRARRKKKPVTTSCRMDETDINVKGQWKSYYRAVDKYGCVIDFLLCDRRDEKAARAFFTKAIGYNGLPEKVVNDKSGANALALHNINVQRWLTGRILNLKYFRLSI